MVTGIPKTMLVSAIGIGYHHYRLLGMEKQSSFVPGRLVAHFYVIIRSTLVILQFLHSLENSAASLTMCGGRMSFLERLYNVFINGSGKRFFLEAFFLS